MSRLFATRALMLSAAATTVAFRLAPTMPLGIAGTRSNRMQAVAAPSPCIAESLQFPYIAEPCPFAVRRGLDIVLVVIFVELFGLRLRFDIGFKIAASKC